MRGMRDGTTRTTYPATPIRQGEAMSKPTKTTPQKKRKLARVVLSGGGTHQRPLDPTVARFAHRIATAFSGTTPDETNTTPETRQKDPTP